MNKMDWDDDMEAWIQEQEELAGLMENECPPTTAAKTGESQCSMIGDPPHKQNPVTYFMYFILPRKSASPEGIPSVRVQGACHRDLQ